MTHRMEGTRSDCNQHSLHVYDLGAGRESKWSQISRECHMIADGLNKGAIAAVKETFTDPVGLVTKTSYGAVWGTLMYAGVINAVPLKAVPIVAPIAVATIPSLVPSDAKKLKALGAAIQDYWNNPGNTKKDSEAVKNTLPSLIIDEAIIGLGCKLGLRLMGLR